MALSRYESIRNFIMMMNSETYKVLLIEDNPDHSFLVKSHLQAKGRYQVEIAASGEQGVEWIRENPSRFDIVLLDYNLPDQTGLDILRRIQSISRFIPVVVITGLGSEAVAVELMKAGAKDYVIKTGEYYKALHITLDQVMEKHKFEMLNLQLQQQLEERANKDFLTGVYNRHRFTELFEHEIHSAKRYKRPISVAMIDLDKFKDINDRYGHKMGDFALVCISDLLKQQLRASDIIGRYGGDEFIVVMPETDKGQAQATFERIQQALESFNKKGQFPCELSLSIGVSSSSESGYDNLIELADAAMYRNKQAKKRGLALPIADSSRGDNS
ncbi:MAG: diguanylate cyclase [Chloroherpetonaceae bacterium]|nr:diguanylate cyclase [Chloroherpetonaceae bacterium]MCS7211996.1 diguanylate cyclase [Chloroherpetonaceae bacterium]MDW8020318.1 diguanylate cyclase [Chloroherpetonaceae bacterium]